jgi:UDP-2,3-diacylglucosamine pyrophosphatase LpxH
VFLGDYVYHFSYDRKALLHLFSIFIELASKGKKLYILAGNHDRISGHFVFEEARQTLLFT